jgi:hypothetical protein
MLTSQAFPNPAPATLWSRIRVVVFILCACFIVGGPLARQVFGVPGRHLPRWVMFGGIGLGLLDVRYEQAHSDGTRTLLNRRKLLKGRVPPGELRRVVNVDKAWNIAQALCKKLGGDADIRVTARNATRKGWRNVLDGTVNACTTKAPPQKTKKKAKKDRAASNQKKPRKEGTH